ncbi:hypothetical protein IVA95_27655 [Bradyrhizobium sp. 157]|nr:hypothetical protein [Bradyrhizobium sp. 157]
MAVVTNFTESTEVAATIKLTTAVMRQALSFGAEGAMQPHLAGAPFQTIRLSSLTTVFPPASGRYAPDLVVFNTDQLAHARIWYEQRTGANKDCA